MVTKQLKEQVKQLVGRNLTYDFSDFLKKNGYAKKDGNPYGGSHLRTYLSKDYTKSKLDEPFLKYWKEKLRERKKEAFELEKLQDETKNLVNN